MDSGLFVLHMKGMLTGSCLLTLGIRYPWVGQSLPNQQSPKISKHHKILKIIIHKARQASTLNIFLWKGISPLFFSHWVYCSLGSEVSDFWGYLWPSLLWHSDPCFASSSVGARDFKIQAQVYWQLSGFLQANTDSSAHLLLWICVFCQFCPLMVFLNLLPH